MDEHIEFFLLSVSVILRIVNRKGVSDTAEFDYYNVNNKRIFFYNNI